LCKVVGFDYKFTKAREGNACKCCIASANMKNVYLVFKPFSE